MGAGPLNGLTVVDLTTFLSGPYATMVLGDLGADVIKVEPPRTGDPTRVIPPHFQHGDSAYYHSTNRNKMSVALDLKSPEGFDALLAVATRADVLIENFRPGVMARLGLGLDRLRAANARLVTCSLTGFGHDGPYRNRPAYDMIVQALSGGMSLTGEPGGNAVRSGIPIGDLGAGLYSVIGILAALRQRDATGEPQHVDVAMLDCQISMLSYQGQYCLASGEVPGRQGARHDSIPTYRSFRCRGGQEIVVTANTETMWKDLCGVLGLSRLVEDPRFLKNSDRLAHRAELWAIIEPAFADRDASEVLSEMVERGIPCARINSIAEALEDPQVLERGMVATAEGSGNRSVRMTGAPLNFADTGPKEYSIAPRLGEHTREVMERFAGMPAEKVDALLASGAAVGGEAASEAKD